MRIGIDVDGVLRDLHQPLLDRWFEMTGIRKQKSDIKGWEIHEYLEIKKAGYSATEFYEWWLTDRTLMYFAPVIPGCISVLSALAEKHELYIASAPIYSVGRHATIDWIEDNLPEVWNGIFFGGDKGILSLDVLIDDYHKNLEMSSAPMRLLFHQPWNADRTDFEHVNGWKEIANLLGG